MNLQLLSDDVSEKMSGGSVSIDNLPTDEATSLILVEHGIASSLMEQMTGDLLAADGDGLAQIHLQQIDKIPADTPDSLLSTSDTLSSYSGCSVGGVGEPFVAVFGGVQEVSQDDVWNRVDNSNDDDSAVHICNVDGSLCGSVASSQDQNDECMTNVTATLSHAVDDTNVQKVENNSLSLPWYWTRINFISVYI